LNANLPRDIRVTRIERVAADFDAVRHATGKMYRYVYDDSKVGDIFARGYCWRVHYPLDVAKMQQAADAFVGKHDFRAFESNWPNRASSVRTVRLCSVSRFGGFVYLDIEA